MMNHKKLIFYLLLLFSNNTSYSIALVLEYPKISLFSATTFLFLTILFSDYLFKLACKYNCYNVIKLCNPNNWRGYRLVNYDSYDRYAGNYGDGFHQNSCSQKFQSMLFDGRSSLEVALWYGSQETACALADYPDIFIFNDGACCVRLVYLMTITNSRDVFDIYKNKKREQVKKIISKGEEPNTFFCLYDDFDVAKIKTAVHEKDIKQIEILLANNATRKSITPQIAQMIIDITIEKNSTNKKEIIQDMLKYVSDPTATLLSLITNILFYHSCEISWDLIDFLINLEKIDVKKKFDGKYTFIHYILIIHGKYSKNRKIIIDLINKFKNVNFQEDPILYPLCSYGFDLSQIHFLSYLSQKEKKNLVEQQLDLLSEGEISNGKEFFKIFLQYGGDLNYRIKKAYRPVDITHDFLYDYLLNSSNNGSNVKETYYYLLQKTPYISDGGLLIILMQQLNIKDVVCKIMKYHTTLTIDRYRAVESPYERFFISKHAEGLIKKEILDERCKKDGYLDPAIHHGNNTLRNRLAIT